MQFDLLDVLASEKKKLGKIWSLKSKNAIRKPVILIVTHRYFLLALSNKRRLS